MVNSRLLKHIYLGFDWLIFPTENTLVHSEVLMKTQKHCFNGVAAIIVKYS